MSIVLDNVAKAFDGKTVLDGFSLEIKDGETVCIMGPSGCGKTTLFNIMLGLIKPDGGSVPVCRRERRQFFRSRGCVRIFP